MVLSYQGLEGPSRNTWDLPIQICPSRHPPSPRGHFTLASPDNTCAGLRTNMPLSVIVLPTQNRELQTCSRTWAHLPPPTSAHRQHLHVLKLQGGVGWVQRSTVVSHVHVDKRFGEAHPPRLHHGHSPCPGCPPERLQAEPGPRPPRSHCLLPGTLSAFLPFKLSSWRISQESWPSLCDGVEALLGRGGG